MTSDELFNLLGSVLLFVLIGVVAYLVWKWGPPG